MQIFDGFNAPTKARSAGARGAVLLPVAASLVLAACGGGSSGGGVQQPPPVVCTATDGGGSGFALGVCVETVRSAFQPVEATVVPTDVPSYALTLTGQAPATLTETWLTSDNKLTTGTRDVIGGLRGVAYEADSDSDKTTLTPPYAALIDFRTVTNAAAQDALVLQLEFASFGVWERFATTSDADGYFGGWYAARPVADAVNERPTTPRQYSGVAVGVLSPSEPGGAYSSSFGFSATVTVSANGNGIQFGTISDMKISYGPQEALVVEPVEIKVMEFSGTANPAGEPSNAALVTSTGNGADATGLLEARFFGNTSGSPASLGKEIAGRFRFQTTDGSKFIGVGSFGVRAPDAP
jgi:hypothetical protein